VVRDTDRALDVPLARANDNDRLKATASMTRIVDGDVPRDPNLACY
jgi:hypothetical protein